MDLIVSIPDRCLSFYFSRCRDAICPLQCWLQIAHSSLSSALLCQTLLSPLLKEPRMVLLSSLLWWELGTNLPGPGPGEWLAFWHITSKRFWFWFRFWFIQTESKARLNMKSTSLLNTAQIQICSILQVQCLTSDTWSQVISSPCRFLQAAVA